MRLVAVVAFAALAACAPDGTTTDEVPVCAVRFAAPAGFAPLEPFEELYPDRVGVRLGYRDVERREFHVFAGIRGEFGEGLPAAGELELSSGVVGEMAGRDGVWVVTWDLGDRCDPRSVLASGFSRRGFERALVDAGLMDAPA